ncbi:hypothetical protein [Bailinhaonella thermotolerans]|uniref:hypothetical protein n=1 Tax=Bailinhaonella thermotolerans TaxID=1070861 RepID=UPI00192A4ABB|nr:hypothetical protein [Bailinhaonella thermotolerans]
MNGRTETMEIISPNNVLANAMLRAVDMVRPRLQATNPDRVAFCVGTQINGAPHLGTSLVQTAAFLLAKQTSSCSPSRPSAKSAWPSVTTSPCR